ncbi:hypothetical protein K1719_040420 [Acacia pycnantha]|nr:hypothetical protein K1719_040420 [Acacia pycnantha]
MDLGHVNQFDCSEADSEGPNPGRKVQVMAKVRGFAFPEVEAQAPTYQTSSVSPSTEVRKNFTTLAPELPNDSGMPSVSKDNTTTSSKNESLCSLKNENHKPSQNDNNVEDKNFGVPFPNKGSSRKVPEVLPISEMNTLLLQSHASYPSMRGGENVEASHLKPLPPSLISVLRLSLSHCPFTIVIASGFRFHHYVACNVHNPTNVHDFTLGPEKAVRHLDVVDDRIKHCLRHVAGDADESSIVILDACIIVKLKVMWRLTWFGGKQIHASEDDGSVDHTVIQDYEGDWSSLTQNLKPTDCNTLDQIFLTSATL